MYIIYIYIYMVPASVIYRFVGFLAHYRGGGATSGFRNSTAVVAVACIAANYSAAYVYVQAEKTLLSSLLLVLLLDILLHVCMSKL